MAVCVLFLAASSKYLVRFVFLCREKTGPVMRLRDSEVIFLAWRLNDGCPGRRQVTCGCVSSSGELHLVCLPASPCSSWALLSPPCEAACEAAQACTSEASEINVCFFGGYSVSSFALSDCYLGSGNCITQTRCFPFEGLFCAVTLRTDAIAIGILGIFSICKDSKPFSQVLFLLSYKYNALFYNTFS